MSPLHSRFLFLSFLVLSFILLGLGGMTAAFGADCGDGVGPCSCGDRVTKDTTLNATDPVTTTVCSDNGLIVADGVALNLQATIRGSGAASLGVGILLEAEANGVTIARGRIEGFFTGLAAQSSTNGNRFFNLLIAENFDGGGIFLEGNNNALERNTIRSNTSEGITLIGNENTVSSNVVESSDGIGVFVDGANNTIARNVVVKSKVDGLGIAGTSNLVFRNRVTGLGQDSLSGHGLHIVGSLHTVSGNILSDNGMDGILVEATDSAFDRNRSDENGGFGIQDTTGAGTNTYTLNVCNGNKLGKSSPPGLCR